MTSFLIITTDYWPFRRWLRDTYPEIAGLPYEEQLRLRADTLFGLADFYSDTLRELGHEARDVVANSELLQSSWGRENGIALPRSVGEGRFASLLRRASRAAGRPSDEWLLEVLSAQVRAYRPDVILNQAMEAVSGRFLRTLGAHFGLLLGQDAHGRVPDEDVRQYDTALSAIPSTVAKFARAGVPSFLLKHAFHPRVLRALEPGEPVEVSFVGSLSPMHSSRIRFLETIAERCPGFRVWSSALPASPLLRERYAGPAWGREMYGVLYRSRVTLNHHLDGVDYADNCRLFEATGVGTLLVTDWKQNLPELFEPKREVGAYRTPEECAELVGHYLAHGEEREAIARAGQERTLREHTYRARMEDLLEIVGGLRARA